MALVLGGDCEGTATPADDVVFLGFVLPPTGGGAMAMVLVSLAMMLTGSALLRARRRPAR